MPLNKIIISEPYRKATISYSDTSTLIYTHDHLKQLLEKCDFMHALVPCKSVIFDQVGSTDRWKYDIELDDGRMWSQELSYADPQDIDPPMTFDIADEWRISELSRQRDIRDLLMHLKIEHGATKIEIEYGNF